MGHNAPIVRPVRGAEQGLREWLAGPPREVDRQLQAEHDNGAASSATPLLASLA